MQEVPHLGDAGKWAESVLGYCYFIKRLWAWLNLSKKMDPLMDICEIWANPFTSLLSLKILLPTINWRRKFKRYCYFVCHEMSLSSVHFTVHFEVLGFGIRPRITCCWMDFLTIDSLSRGDFRNSKVYMVIEIWPLEKGVQLILNRGSR